MDKEMKYEHATEEEWENGELGADEEFVRVSNDVDEEALDEATGLKPISIRLEKSLIEDFKMIAELNGIGYQPLMRQVLKRFADAEKKQILRDKFSEMQVWFDEQNQDFIDVVDQEDGDGRAIG